MQIWSGLIARTAPEWSLLVRSPVNLARSQGYEHYEGIIETDRWFGPLFTNVRLERGPTFPSNSMKNILSYKFSLSIEAHMVMRWTALRSCPSLDSCPPPTGMHFARLL